MKNIEFIKEILTIEKRRLIDDLRTKTQNGLSATEAVKYYEKNINEKYDKLNEALYFLDKVGNLLWDLESQAKRFKED